MTSALHVTGPWRSVQAITSSGIPGLQFTGNAIPAANGIKGYELTAETALAAAGSVEWMYNPASGRLYSWAQHDYQNLRSLVAAKGLSGNDEAIGSSFNDIFRMGAGDDRIYARAGNDVLDGGSGNDILHGQQGNDIIIGGTGADKMFGGEGNDVFYVDNIRDEITEGSGGGNDTAYASVSYALGKDQWVETLAAEARTARTAIDLTGNEYAQTILGNEGANRLNGGGGADKLVGYGGNDSYYVDDARDQVVEAAGQGVDAVYASVSYALGQNQEIEALATTNAGATLAINLTGNDANQSISGNAGGNKLSGLGGADALFGFGGADVLNGGLGSDKLTGGLGNDAFVFDSRLGGGNVDTISDFHNVVGDNDLIQLARTVFTALSQTGALAAGAFMANASGLATQADDRIVYETDTGKLFYDADGSGKGAAVLFATLTGHPALTHADFFVI